MEKCQATEHMARSGSWRPFLNMLTVDDVNEASGRGGAWVGSVCVVLVVLMLLFVVVVVEAVSVWPTDFLKSPFNFEFFKFSAASVEFVVSLKAAVGDTVAGGLELKFSFADGESMVLALLSAARWLKSCSSAFIDDSISKRSDNFLISSAKLTFSKLDVWLLT